MVGIDIEKINKFQNKTINFYEKIFTTQEIEYVKKYKFPAQHYAGIFCAKEAVMKALGHGMDEINFKDIEVYHDNKNKPFVKLQNKAEKYFLSIGKEIHISISHTQTIATAICLIN